MYIYKTTGETYKKTTITCSKYKNIYEFQIYMPSIKVDWYGQIISLLTCSLSKLDIFYSKYLKQGGSKCNCIELFINL